MHSDKQKHQNHHYYLNHKSHEKKEEKRKEITLDGGCSSQLFGRTFSICNHRQEHPHPSWS